MNDGPTNHLVGPNGNKKLRSNLVPAKHRVEPKGTKIYIFQKLGPTGVGSMNNGLTKHRLDQKVPKIRSN